MLLISEISQSSGLDQLEIVNLGPASMDLNCLEISRIASDNQYTESLMVSSLPALSPTVLGVGEVMVFDFATDAPGSMSACYSINFMGSVYDEVSVNGYGPCGAFTGILNSGDVYRFCEADSNDASDWKEGENCFPLTIGQLNPDLGKVDYKPPSKRQTTENELHFEIE